MFDTINIAFTKRYFILYNENKIAFCFKKGCFIGPKNQRFRLKKGCFSRLESAKGGYFSSLGTSVVYVLVGSGGPGSRHHCLVKFMAFDLKLVRSRPLWPSDATWRLSSGSTLHESGRVNGTEPLPDPMLNRDYGYPSRYNFTKKNAQVMLKSSFTIMDFK